MREPHPVFDRDIDPKAVVWRYFDFSKFTALLQTGALWFSRGSLLGDPMEGSFTQSYATQRQHMLENPPAGRTRQDLEAIFRHNEQIFAMTPQELYVNCWHLGDHESMAMWQGYGGGPYGIAIRSDFESLDESILEHFTGPFRNETIYIGKVRYIDHMSLTESIPHVFNAYDRMVCKSLAYRHENEVRAMFLDTTVWGSGQAAPGHLITVDLRRLIHAVVVSSLAPPWFCEVVERTWKACGYDLTFATSIAATSPIF